MRKRITPALLLSVIAIVLSLTGGAFAASLITGKQVKDGSIESRDLRDGTIRARDVRAGAITLTRLSPEVRTLLDKAGMPGKDGVNGTDGAAGKNGVDGTNGAQGPAGPQGAAGTSGLPDEFYVTNTSVRVTDSGVRFGPYADGGAAGGSLFYGGLNGQTLSDIQSLSYKASYTTADAKALGAPYLRVFLNDDTSSVVFDPTECATATPAEGTSLTFDVTGGDVRYNDDSCDGVAPDQQPWSDVVADHGGDVISGIYVTTGFAGGHDVRASLTELSVNDDVFTFPLG